METQKVITVITVVLVLAMSGSALGTTYYVKTTGSDNNNGTSWPTAFATIQKGVDAASATEVRVEEGTYTLTSDIDVDVAVTIYGGYDSTTHDRDSVNNVTIVDGNNSVRCFDVYAVATIDGFTISDGNAGNSDGGGMRIGGRTPTIEECVFIGNKADDGGGIFNDGYDGTVIDDCVFYNNHADDDGGGISNRGGAPEISSCLFTGNSAGDYGGGMYSDESGRGTGEMLMVNCTFYGNIADRGGGMFNDEDVDMQIDDCIVWDNDANSGEEIYNDCDDTDVEVECSDIKGGINGSRCGGCDSDDDRGNIDSDPNFVNPNDPDGNDDIWRNCDDGFNIPSDSPCVDAGCEGEDDYDDEDIKDANRELGPDPDMGAYEYDSGC
ncbi:MAG: right-handed parallel beta-helix repeat-containing protein [Planctomycetota bacterium]